MRSLWREELNLDIPLTAMGRANAVVPLLGARRFNCKRLESAFAACGVNSQTALIQCTNTMSYRLIQHGVVILILS